MFLENENFIKEQIKNCNLCSLCKVRYKSVCPCFLKCDILFVSTLFDESFLKGDFELFKEQNSSLNAGYTALLKCEPKQNSNFLKNTNLNECIAFCKPHFDFELKIASPKVLVTLGKDAYISIAGQCECAFGSLVGGVYRMNDFFIVPIFESAFLAKNPSLKGQNMKILSKIKGLL